MNLVNQLSQQHRALSAMFWGGCVAQATVLWYPVVSCGILWLLGYFGFLIIEVLTIGGPSRYSPLWGRCGLDIPPLDVEIFQIWQPCSGHSAGQHCFSVLQCTSSTASNRSTVWCTPTPSGRALWLDLGLKSCSSHTGAPFELRWT